MILRNYWFHEKQIFKVVGMVFSHIKPEQFNLTYTWWLTRAEGAWMPLKLLQRATNLQENGVGNL